MTAASVETVPHVTWALAYAAVGYPVLPLTPGGNTPHGQLLGRGWHFCPLAVEACTRVDCRGLVGSVDPGTLLRWWDADPRANVGVVTGCRSRLLVIDIDKKGAASWNGYDSWRRWVTSAPEAAGGAGLPAHPRVVTPSLGLHRWFLLPEGEHLRTKLNWLERVDAKACGGFVAVPPSQRPDGEYYHDDPGPIPLVPEAPQWLLEDVETRPASPPPRERRADLSGPVWPAGGGLPPTSEFLAYGFGWFTGSRDLDCYRLAWRLWQTHGRGDVVLELIRCCWSRTDQFLNGHPFTWEQAAGKVRSAEEGWRSRRAVEQTESETAAEILRAAGYTRAAHQRRHGD